MLRPNSELSEIVYSSTVVEVGELVDDFAAQGVLVWFGENAPAELREFSIIHRPDHVERAPVVGDYLQINERQFSVLAVGSVVSENLLHLGHLDVKANGSVEAQLPGDLNVENTVLPKVTVGDRLQIIKSGTA
jgi:PTS system glucitol/sorbitol-specific IIA component